jgi:hypothetical protein
MAKKNGCKREDTRHTGAINDKVVVLIFSDFLLKPIHILQEVSALPQKTLGSRLRRCKRCTHVLEAVNKPAIGPIAELAHRVLDRDEVFDIDGRRVLEAVGCRGRIEVYEMAGTFGRLKMCHERSAESRFSGAGWACDENCIAHILFYRTRRPDTDGETQQGLVANYKSQSR